MFDGAVVADGKEHPITGFQACGGKATANLISLTVPLRIGLSAARIVVRDLVTLMLGAHFKGVADALNWYRHNDPLPKDCPCIT